jgi:hypothetical protein
MSRAHTPGIVTNVYKIRTRSHTRAREEEQDIKRKKGRFRQGYVHEASRGRGRQDAAHQIDTHM